ncbi:Isopentenyl-diphosphate delta isomerase [Operophtera brumata]|uniref:isopentenyl-diphosphate Delta-isomerase n=1 Tax=Operophtera brumata TaxID=104452 RepID=A0A0L7L280_OPEBR|nr:Isopentenyl-diphosphate delta isomerase [Operophtera brumata]
MFVRSLTRSLWRSTHLEKRFLATEPAKPQPDVNDGVDPLQDNLTGTATKRECHKVGPDGNVLLHRAFSVFLFNKRGDMFLQRRASQKVTYPDYYTNACCSHPLYIDDKPEEIITAARRRLNHELGIPLNDMDPELFTYMTRVHYHDPGDGVWGEHEIDHVLFFQSDVKVKPNSNEISEYCFVPKAEFNSSPSNLIGFSY